MLIESLIVIFVIQMAFFAYAAIRKTDIVTDLSYGLTFIILVWYVVFRTSSFAASELLLAAVVTFWGIRLSGYLFARILKMKKDKRFDGIRENFISFLKFWLLQGISIWIISLPFIVYIFGYGNELSPWHIIYSLLTVFGIIFEGIADYQKTVFKSDSTNKGKWIQSGLWKYSRHPNYFGEMVVWWSIFIYVLPYITVNQWVTVISPIFIMVLLLFVTGVPTLEKRYDEKYKNDKEYWQYKKNTSMIIPRL